MIKFKVYYTLKSNYWNEKYCWQRKSLGSLKPVRFILWGKYIPVLGCSSKNEFIHSFIFYTCFILLSVTGCLEPIPATIVREAGYTLDRLLLHHRVNTYADRILDDETGWTFKQGCLDISLVIDYQYCVDKTLIIYCDLISVDKIKTLLIANWVFCTADNLFIKIDK